MNKLKFMALLIVFTLGIASIQAQEASPVITLERTACFGTCPIYTVSIFADGTVRYEGSDFVDVTGEQTAEIDPATVERMVEAFASAGYFEWDETYDTQTVTDLPTMITSVTRDGATHRIVRYAGDGTAPLALAFLEQWIDRMAGTAMWTGVQPDAAAISNGTDTPLITLERTLCFGTCPVYTVALFEDGTVVYTGTANVDNFGVHIFEVEPAAITSIAQRAQATGYFNWQDSYEEFVMTDQPTTITSIRWEDDFKRIVRYGGDPNAPVGLVWVEDSIDLTVPAAAD